MKDWSTKITLRETLSRAEKWPGEAYFDGDKHRLVLGPKTKKASEQLLARLAETAEYTSSTILELVSEISEPKPPR